MESAKIRGIAHFIFDSIDEFNEHHGDNPPLINFDWRNAEKGEWVMSDDNRIVQILVRKSMKSSNSRGRTDYYVRTVVGTFPCYKWSKMDTDFTKHKDRYSFGGNLQDNRYISSSDRVRAFASVLLVTGDPWKTYNIVFPGNRSMLYAQNRIKKVLGDPRLIDMINEHIHTAAKTLGITAKSVLEKYWEIVNNGEKDESRIKALDRVSDLLELNPTVAKITSGYTPMRSSTPISEAELIDARAGPAALSEHVEEEVNDVPSTVEEAEDGGSHREACPREAVQAQRGSQEDDEGAAI